MGFGAEVKSKEKKLVGEVLKKILPEDLLKFGLIPEFVGRLPVIVTLDALDEDALVRILVEPKNALAKQYQKFLELDNVQLEFKDDALRAIAEEALKRNTGARGLRAIIEAIMRNVMYDIPSRSDVTKCIVTKEVVINKEEPILVTVDRKSKKKEESA
jgi:ATP-dependent Clp protease ATP-binding subunit ClpX